VFSRFIGFIALSRSQRRLRSGKQPRHGSRLRQASAMREIGSAARVGELEGFFDLPFTFSPFFAALSIKARSRSKNRVVLAGDRTYAACLQRIAVSAIFREQRRSRRNASISVSNSLRCLRAMRASVPSRRSANRTRLGWLHSLSLIRNYELGSIAKLKRVGKYREIRRTPRDPPVGELADQSSGEYLRDARIWI